MPALHNQPHARDNAMAEAHRAAEAARRIINAETLEAALRRYRAALADSGGKFTASVEASEIPLFHAIYAITECDDVFDLAESRMAELGLDEAGYPVNELGQRYGRGRAF